MDNYDFEEYLIVDAELEKLKTAAEHFGSNVHTENYREHQLSVFIDLDRYFRARIFFNFWITKNSINRFYHLSFQQRRLSDGVYGTIDPKRHLVPKYVLQVGDYRDGHYNIPYVASISQAGIDVINIIKSNIPELLQMCRKSTRWYNEKKMMETTKQWRSEATILGISKEKPMVRGISGIKQQTQWFYDSCYGLHGSNGTYVENANLEWVLKVRIKRLDFADDTPIIKYVDIQYYITQILMPRLGWEKISAARLEKLNKTIHHQKTDVVTTDMDVAPLYREFTPCRFTNWEAWLDAKLKG